MDSRELSLNIISDVLEKGKYSHNMLNKTLTYHGYLEKRERSFITRLCEGTIEKKLTLDYIINHYSKIRIDKMRPVIRNILRMGIYQMIYMDQVPASAACNESVKLVKKRKLVQLSGFVNGVLRAISRDIDKLPESILEGLDEIEQLSVRYSVPVWIIEKYMDFYGKLMTEEILKGYTTENKLTIRCNLNNCTMMELKASLEQEGVIVEPAKYFAYALKISGFDTLNELTAFKNGWFQVQDESSMFVGEMGRIKEDMFILDLCAAPGGKSLHYADRIGMIRSGHIEARDFSEEKLRLISENVDRNKVDCISVRQADATVLDETMIDKADLVLADLPCSGLGILAKKPDIRYQMTAEKQNQLVQLQKSILNNAVRYVKPGGTLVYSTCTINKAENENMVGYITDRLGMKTVDISDMLPDNIKCLTATEGYIQLLPGIHGMDGFFIAVFKK